MQLTAHHTNRAAIPKSEELRQGRHAPQVGEKAIGILFSLDGPEWVVKPRCLLLLLPLSEGSR
jgi:hypothetical protein